MRDIEWLKDEIGKFVEPYDMRDQLTYMEGVVDIAEHMLHLVNQLDESEILSQEWIDEHVVYADVRGGTEEFIRVNDLQNLLVPKNELPVIPKFVAERIEKYIEYGYDLYPALKKMENDAKVCMKTYNWYKKNTLKFVNAYLTGEYKLEKEPLYRARLKIITNELIASYLCTQPSDAVDRLKGLEIGSKYINEDFRHLSEFTEDELRVIGIWGSEQWEIEEVEE